MKVVDELIDEIVPEEIERVKNILKKAGYKVFPEARVLTINDAHTIDPKVLENTEDVPGVVKVFQVSMGGKMGRYLAVNKGITFRDREGASGGKHVEGELTVILPDVS
ncbi:MAG TPA: hypothetical protein VGJ20_43430 [Xanthobacteraceae bacterium]|jgi:hypothetical protein